MDKSSLIKKDKRADSRLLSPWLFIAFGIIGVGIVLGVLIFYSIGIDIKLEESKAMNNKLVGLVVENGYLNENVLKSDFNVLNILKEAGIDEKAIDSGYYYFNLTIFQDDIGIKTFVSGTEDFEIQCSLPGEQMAKCSKKELVLLDGNGGEYRIKILTGSNQLGSKL